MADEMYYQHGGRQHGPVTGAELKELAAAGELLPDDLIWKDGMEKWVPAKQVRGLFPNEQGKARPAANSPPPMPDQSPPEAGEWYYASGDQRHGPVSFAELRRLAASDTIEPTDLMWKDGMDEWVPASTVRGLFTAKDGPPVLPSTPRKSSPRAAAKSGTGVLVCSILSLAGSLGLLLAFVLPWWGMTVKFTGSETNFTDWESAMTLKFNAVGFGEASMFLLYFKTDTFEAIGSQSPTLREGLTLRVWGWHTAAGKVALVSSLLVIGFTIVSLTIAAIRPWGWIGSFVGAVPTLVALILSLSFLFICPSGEFGIIGLSYTWGAGIGPYLALAASLLLLPSCITGGVLGLISFLASRSPTVAA